MDRKKKTVVKQQRKTTGKREMITQTKENEKEKIELPDL